MVPATCCGESSRSRDRHSVGRQGRHYAKLRRTAADKSNELLFHMLIAVVSVSILIAITLGLRESLIVFIAIPVTLALTLASSISTVTP